MPELQAGGPPDAGAGGDGPEPGPPAPDPDAGPRVAPTGALDRRLAAVLEEGMRLPRAVFADRVGRALLAALGHDGVTDFADRVRSIGVDVRVAGERARRKKKWRETLQAEADAAMEGFK